MAEAGIDINACAMVQADPWDATAAGLLLDAAPHATAILSMSVMQGMAMVDEAQRRGIDVPGDMSIIGYNDNPAAAHSRATDDGGRHGQGKGPCSRAHRLRRGTAQARVHLSGADCAGLDCPVPHAR